MEKDFLKSVSNEYPSSFSEEKFVSSEKSYKGLIIGIISVFVVILLGIIIYFVMNKKITMKNLVGETKEALNIWIKENGLNNKNIVISYDYDLEYDENIVIYQSVDEGEKISKNKVLTFTLSKGADPDQSIKFPDIKTMTYDEIKDWITNDKLTNVKINQEFNDKFEKNTVISYNLKNISEDDFKRNSSLTIVVSKGAKPKTELTLDNYVGKSVDNLTSYAALHNLNVNTNAIFSSREIGEIIYQSPAAGETIHEGDTITVSISKGEGVAIPYLIGQSKANVERWADNNNVTVSYNEVYNATSKNKVIDQSINANTMVGAGDTLVVTVSLGMPYLTSYIGQDVDELLSWIEDVNSKGGNINVQINEKKYYSDSVSKNGIINQNKNGYIGLNETINITLSLGSKVLVDTNYVGLDEADVKAFCSNLNCIYDYKKSSMPIGTVIEIKVNDKNLVPDMYINSSDVILVTISEGA